MVWVEELGHCSQKGIEEYHNSQLTGGGGAPPPGGNGNGNGDSNGSRGGDRPPPPRGNGGDNGDDDGDGGGDDSPLHCLIMDSQDTVEVKEIDGCTCCSRTTQTPRSTWTRW